MLIQDQPVTHGLWLLTDDTEEDLVGSDVHQDAIDAVFEGVWLAGPQQGRRWHVGRQLMLLIPDIGLGKDWHPSPDLMVHPDADPAPLSAFDTRTLGMPPLLVEVASPSTVAYDRGAKRNGYFLAGVREYLVFDPTGEWISEQVDAWRREEGGAVVPWRPSEGRWRSTAVGIAFASEGLILRVYDAAGEAMPTFREQARLRAQQQRALAAQEQALVAQERALAAQDQVLAAQEQALAERDQALAAQEQALADRDRRVAELEARLRALGDHP
jgi:Uma2 family endonuclease